MTESVSATGDEDAISFGEQSWRVFAVYGDVSGNVDETYPYEYTGNPYGDSKIEAETICWEYYERGLPICILRPTIVYGPFSKLWTIEFAQGMQSGAWLLPQQYCQGICNLVYIDDLVSAIVLALQKQEAIGKAFNINGGENLKWNELKSFAGYH